jgi:hypothetical protein
MRCPNPRNYLSCLQKIRISPRLISITGVAFTVQTFYVRIYAANKYLVCRRAQPHLSFSGFHFYSVSSKYTAYSSRMLCCGSRQNNTAFPRRISMPVSVRNVPCVHCAPTVAVQDKCQLVSGGTEHEKLITGHIIAPTVLRSQPPVLQMPYLLPSIAEVLHPTPCRAKRGCMMLAEREPSGIGKLLRELRDG